MGKIATCSIDNHIKFYTCLSSSRLEGKAVDDIIGKSFTINDFFLIGESFSSVLKEIEKYEDATLNNMFLLKVAVSSYEAITVVSETLAGNKGSSIDMIVLDAYQMVGPSARGLVDD
jgi:hypothetical protein